MIDLVDRGGLIHVDDSLYSMFLAMEVEVRKHLGNASEGNSTKQAAIDGIMNNDEVKHFWSMIISDDRRTLGNC